MMTKKGVAAALAGTVFLLGVSLLAFIPVFNGCTKSMCHIDLGLYYLKLIRWIQTFPIVPGLVNVQEQLAFNQNAFLVTSLFDSLVPNRWGIFLIAGFLAWLGLSLSVFAIFRLVFLRFQRRESAQPSKWRMPCRCRLDFDAGQLLDFQRLTGLHHFQPKHSLLSRVCMLRRLEG